MRSQFRVAVAASALAGMIPPASLATQPVAPTAFEMADFGRAAGIAIDGKLESIWLTAPVADAFEEYRPRQGVPASVRTEVRMGRDATHFYLAARMFDPDISRLRSGLARRDNFSNEQDWFSVALDAVGSSRGAQLFYFNAQGVIWDGLLNEDTGSANPAADFEVEVTTRVESDSWVLELRIPFEELRYRSRTPDEWRVIFRRNYPREDRHAMASPGIPATPPCLMCLAAPLRPPGELPAPRGFSFVPQLLGLGRRETGAGENGGWSSEVEPGIEVKLRAGPATVFDATLNPDFSQVELDTPQLSSNQQFAVAFPEKRPFFLEGIDILDSPLAAIYTRSITDPSWGVRGTHRGDWDGALLTTRDDGGGAVVIPGPYSASYAAQDFTSQATIGRVRKPVGDVTVGGLLTDRRTDDSYNSVAGPDFAWRLSPTTRVSAQWLTSRTRVESGSAGISGDSRGDAAGIDLLHDTRHWRGVVTLRQLDPEFRADNGYIPQVGIRQVATELWYKFTDLRAMSELAPYITTDTREDFEHHTVSSAPRLGAQATLSNNMIVTGEWRPRAQVRVREGSTLHSLAQGYLSLTSYPAAWLPVLNLELTAGQAVDFAADRVGRGETVSASLLWRPLARLVIEPRFDFTTVRTQSNGFEPAQQARESAAQLLATLHLTVRDRFRLMVQRVGFERERQGVGALVDSSQLSGSLLFTHEHSLARRIYVGVAFARDAVLNEAQAHETFEVFFKIQSGMSPATGIRW
jgi:hypothetical protein